ncbi:hypothetical protein SDC9_173896 [bioreactor metagenome]|uniref:Uncharacterized protein n=1 Tax=bioreactor metagenome TaxID=1076179 RepID=A0A645GHL7_9ZZZZ
MVNTHGNRAGIGDYHRLAREFVLTVLLVVLYNVLAQGGDGLFCTKDAVHLTEFLLTLLDGVWIGVSSHDIVFSVD